MKLRLLMLMLCLATGIAQAESANPPELTLKDQHGKTLQPLNPGEKMAAVLVFYSHDCPICNSYAPELNRIAARYTNFNFYILQVDPDLTPAAAAEHARKFNLHPTVLLDPQHRLVKAVGATVTPEAVVVGKNHRIFYRGRIDDSYLAPTKKRAAVVKRDLIEALDSINAGKLPKRNQTELVGCYIE